MLPRGLSRNRRANGWAYLLACVVLLAQTLALAHRVAHARPDVERPWFGQHQAGDKDCKLFDELCGGASLPVAVVPAAPPAPPEHQTPRDAAPTGRIDARAYRARAPPRA